jgi:uncharacterized membrane protein YeaQ/YmgE (transglycosylase-associated protein family)
MNILIYLIVAALIGWAATVLMHDHSNLLLNIVIAVLGAFLAGYLLSLIFRGRNDQQCDHSTNHAHHVIGVHNPFGDLTSDPPHCMMSDHRSIIKMDS